MISTDSVAGLLASAEISFKALATEVKSASSRVLRRVLGANPAKKQVSFTDTGPKPRQVFKMALSRRAAKSSFMRSMIAVRLSVKIFNLSCIGGNI